MSAAGDFYLGQVALCDKAAAAASLPNQRDKYVRAGAAWQALADREIGIRAARDKQAAEKAALRIAAEG